MRVLHGENTLQSRKRLQSLIDAAISAGVMLNRLEAKSMTRAQLEEAVASTNLFAEPRLLVIEELHSLPPSQRKTELVAFLQQASTQPEAGTEIILWEKKLLTATMKKAFPEAQFEDFPLAKSMFQWLDALVGSPNHEQRKKMLQLFRLACSQDGEIMCLVMLARQLRFLIEISGDGNISSINMAPFMQNKLARQAKSFPLSNLLQLHHQLLLIDLKQKTSVSGLSMSKELEVLHLSL